MISVYLYVDPSLMTYIVQAAIGIAVAVAAAVGVHLRKAKKKVDEKLGLDENRNKEVETDDITFDE